MSEIGSPRNMKLRLRMALAVLIVAVFAVAILVKAGGSGTAGVPGPVPATTPTAATGGPSQSRADASAAYEAARASGKPIYLLFHSLTCVPCIEISAVVDKVVPMYEGEVVFVNAISEDEPSQRLASKFPFQYIPTSFFIDPGGKVVDSFTGAMDEPAMRAYIDRLVAR